MNINIPVSWLKEYLKTDISTKNLANLLSLSGPSVDNIKKLHEDYLFDVEVTTNRPDAFSVYGIAREANAIISAQNLKSELLKPKGLNLNLDPDSSKALNLNVVIKDQNLCPRFAAIVIDNIKIQPSPAYIRNRLQSCGIKVINNIVDITNYIMFELGQPMHVFDFDKIKGATMTLRKSRKGETIKTLDAKTYSLPEGTIVIEDKERLIDLCGIMGGANSGVSRRTKRAVIFVQAYNPQIIRKTTQMLSLRTEAAIRFEKGIDLEGILPALSRAVYLAKQTAEAKIASELIDIYPKKQSTKTIRLNLKKLSDYLGITLSGKKASQILESLGFKTQQNSSQITAVNPTWRSQDVENDVDLIEEIARIYGYHNLPSNLPSGTIPNSPKNELKQIINLKTALKYLGLTEILTYSIISKKLLKTSGKTSANAVELANPLTEEWQFMRPMLIPSILEAVSKNQNIKDRLKFFEIARTYVPQKNTLPKQDLVLALCFSNSNFYEIKGIVENIAGILKKTIRFQKLEKPHPIFDTEKSATVKMGSEQVGLIGVVKAAALEQLNINTETSAAELNLTKYYHSPTITPQFSQVPKYPPAVEDLSAIFAQSLPLEEIIDAIRTLGFPLVKNIEVIDIFENANLGENKKSVTLRLTFQKATGTLTSSETKYVKEKIMSGLQNSFRAKIRN